jgi:two-component system OmpR family sensor kinase
MFSSLRSRLWLSYVVVVCGALLLTAVVLVIYLASSPLVHRQLLARLSAVEELILTNQPELTNLSQTDLQTTLKFYDKTFDVRLLVLNTDRSLLADSRAGTAQPLILRRVQLERSTSTLRDQSGKYWLSTNSKQQDGRYLLVSAPRLIALALSLFLAFGLARWIGNPLQTLVAASQSMPQQEIRPLALRGPREVKELTRTFNAMTARLQGGQKIQREFIANVSHELKTPITSIQGFAQALQDGTADTPAARQQAATIIQDEAARMHRMVLNLLDLARLDAGTLDLQRAQLDLPSLLHNIAEKFTPQANAAGVTIRVETAALPPITGDGDRLAQVFSNLVDNAIKFTPAGGSINLKAVPSGSGVQVNVEDSGAGIAAEAIPRIFDRFYQIDPARPGGQKHGTGLGLAIAAEIVRAHGGTISVRSVPGAGSTFTVTLPPPTPDASTVIRRKKQP